MSTNQQVITGVRSQSTLWQRISDSLFDQRNALLGSAKFQRWAGAFPLTRRISARNAGAVFDIVAGFVYSQILLALVQLKAFDILKSGAVVRADLAVALGLTKDAANTLIDGACSLKLLELRSGDRVGLGWRAAPLVGNTPVLAMIEHHATLYADLRDPVAMLKRRSFDTAMGQYWPYTDVANDGSNDARLKRQVEAYSKLMAASHPFVADEIFDAFSFAKVQRVLDVGGGEGEFVLRLSRHAPHLHLTTFDLPGVAARARARFHAAGIESRATAIGGSFFDDALPTGFDLVTLNRVLHDHDDENALLLLKAIRRALPLGSNGKATGRLLLTEPMAETPGALAMGHAYFGMYLWAMGRGRSRSAQTISTMLSQAGFTSVREIKTRIPLQARILIAS
jgi:demethylspheroidene O-methyltransferase